MSARDRDEKATLLLLGYGERHQALAGRLLLLHFRALRADDLDEACARLAGAQPLVRVAMLPIPLPLTSPRADLARLRDAARPEELELVAVGPRPDEAGREALRAAGLRFVCFEPWTDSELRFILNRAAQASGRARFKVREGLRVPTSWMGRVFGGAGEKPVLVYNVSLGGAYLETHRANPSGARIEVELPLEEGPLRLPARVVSTNVPGNLRRPNLPLGMGVRFEEVPLEASAALERYIERRAREFEL